MIYLDYAAATPVRKEVRKVMDTAENCFANPGSRHGGGRTAKELLESAREKVKMMLNADEKDTIIFTSGGTESINLALKGIASAYREKGDHIITSKAEHKAVLETGKYLEQEGFSVTYLDVDGYGRINPQDVEKAITKKTILISIMYANNEVGTIQPVKEIAAIAKKNKVLFHTDACQAGYLDLDVKKLGVDLLTLNSNKIYGPNGAGLLYVKNGVRLEAQMHGGGQEYGLRSGTENVAAMVGFAKALEMAQKEKETENQRLRVLRDNFISEVQKKISNVSSNGHPTERLSNHIHLSFAGVEAETLLLHLDQQGVYASAGSACTANEINVSHVLSAMKIEDNMARGSIRFTLGKETTDKDIEATIKILQETVASLRKI